MLYQVLLNIVGSPLREVQVIGFRPQVIGMTADFYFQVGILFQQFFQVLNILIAIGLVTVMPEVHIPATADYMNYRFVRQVALFIYFYLIGSVVFIFKNNFITAVFSTLAGCNTLITLVDKRHAGIESS